MRPARRRLTYANVTAGIALFLALSGVAYAVKASPGSGAVVHACSTRTGGLRISASGSCRGGERRLSWNRHGVLGAAGPAGGRGTQGGRGPTGSPGPQGPPGLASGSAGGDLTGSYPSPSIGPGKVTSADVAAGAIGTAQIRDGEVDSSKLGLAPVARTTAYDTTLTKTLSIGCPAGKRLFGGGGGITDNAGLPLATTHVTLTYDGRLLGLFGVESIYLRAVADATAGSWELGGYAMCLNAAGA